jgi:hypothetical protein
MPVIKSRKYVGRQPVDSPTPHRKGETITEIFTHTFTTAVGTADILELMPVFSHGKIVDFEFETANVGAIALNIGLMTGAAGANEPPARTCGSQLIAGVLANAASGRASTLAQMALLQNGVGDRDVSIGLVPAAPITAAANKTITIKLTIVA